MKKLTILVGFLFGCVWITSAQTAEKATTDSLRLKEIRVKLDSVSTLDKAWEAPIEISVGAMPLPELVRNIASNSQVNIGIKGAEGISATCNFSSAKITDLVYYLCKEYHLDLDLVGNIVSIFPVVVPLEIKIPKVEYSPETQMLKYDLENDELSKVAKRLSDVSGVNLIVPQPLLSRQVSGYVSGLPLEQAISALASTNGLRVKKENELLFRIEAKDPQSTSFLENIDSFDENVLSVDSLGVITAQITSGDVQSIIVELCRRMGLNFFFISPISQRTSIYVKEVDFDTLLSLLFSGTPYSFYCENNIYIFGSNASGSGQGLIAAKVIALRNRSVDKIPEIIPELLKRDLQIKQFNDLNSLILCGDQRQIARVCAFLKSIDQKVPLITIEVMIGEITKKTLQELGLTAGLGAAPESPQTYTPFQMTLKSNTINNLLGQLGLKNIGKVSNNFYLTIKALEEKGGLEVMSTPKLSTLNGHEAVLKSGETQYYIEVMNNIIGTQNPIQSESYTWKSLEANMTLRIVPFVSADSTITLDIEIEQSEFTAREEKTAPPGIATRSFKSQIRLHNGEMVLLGGIDRSSKDKTSTGLPLIARIPILRWIFGSTRNNKSDYKLTLFIKPTVIM